MEMTLDEYLDEVDQWKQKAMERTESLSDAAREKVLHDSLRWLENKIGRRLDQLLCFVELAHIGLHGDGLTAKLLDGGGNVTRGIGIGVIIHGHLRAALRQLDRNTPPEAACSASHDCDFAFKCHSLPPVRSRDAALS